MECVHAYIHMLSDPWGRLGYAGRKRHPGCHELAEDVEADHVVAAPEDGQGPQDTGWVQRSAGVLSFEGISRNFLQVTRFLGNLCSLLLEFHVHPQYGPRIYASTYWY